jgi:GT2 family glycosyltransferase
MMGTETEATETLGENQSQWPEVAIIVLNWNNYEDTKKCLESLGEIEYHNYEVIVVDNGSSDQSGEILRSEFDQCHFIFSEENCGFAGGNNIGIRYAAKERFPYIVLLNNDVIASPGFLTPLVITAERQEKIAAVSGLIYGSENNDLWYAGGQINSTLVRDRARGDIGPEPEYSVGKVTGALALLSREFIEEFEILNEDYFIGLEDTEMSWIAQTNGWRLMVNPNSKVTHKVGASRGNDTAYTYYHNTYNRLVFSSNHHTIIQRFVFCLFFIANRCIRFIQWGAHGKFCHIYATILGLFDFCFGNDPGNRQDLYSSN